MDRRAALLTMSGIVGASIAFRYCQARGDSGLLAGQGSSAAKALPPVRQAGSPDFRSVSMTQVPIGGGGFVTGIDVSADGQRFLCRTDVANAYVRNAGDAAWLPLFSPTTMVLEDYDPLPPLGDKADGQGVAGVRIAPSNKNILYASYHGYIWKSEDGGRTIRRTRSPQLAMPSNAGLQRLYNRTIDVHPRQPEVVAVGTVGEGVRYSLDAGRSWKEAALPAAGQSLDGKPGIHLVLFDPAAANRLYVFVTGLGLFCSDQGPAGEFRPLGGGPKHASTLVASAGGSVYLTEQSTSNSGSVWRYRAETGWSSGRPEHEAAALAVDPKDPRRLVASNPNGYIMSSADGGTSWSSLGGAKWKGSAGEVAWTRGLISFFPAEMIFNPIASGQLLVAQGVGVAVGEIRSGTLQVSDWSAGIEELCAVDVLAVPGGKLFLSAWDKSFWRVDDLTSYSNNFRFPLRPGRAHNNDLVAYGSYMDYAGDDPNFIVGVMAPTDSSAPGFTADGGTSWKAFEGTPPAGWGNGGCIAASTRANIVLLPSNNGVGAYTLDGGKSWASITLDGSNPTGGFANSFYVKRQNISADKTRPGTFALVYTTLKKDEFAEPLGGLWVTRNGGRTWTQRLTGVVGPGSTNPRDVQSQSLEARQFWQCQLDYVPGRSGELVYTPHADFTADRFFWSQDDGKSWAELHRSIRNVRAFGFGKAAPGQQRPALYFWGEVRGRVGLHASFDWFASEPRLVTRFPSQMLALVESLGGDLDRFGRVYLGTSCAGWIRVDLEI